MKVTEHVEHLLRQGRKPSELVDLGFPKQVITMVRRQLREERAAQRQKAPAARDGEKSLPEPTAVAPKSIAPIDQRLASLESEIDNLRGRIETMETASATLKDLEARLDSTLGLGLRKHFKCDCGASGFVALHVQCTKCGRESLWGWFPKE